MGNEEILRDTSRTLRNFKKWSWNTLIENKKNNHKSIYQDVDKRTGKFQLHSLGLTNNMSHRYIDTM